MCKVSYFKTWFIPLLAFGFGLAVNLTSASELISSAFVAGNLNGYTELENQLILDDLNNIRQLCFRDTSPAKEAERIYVATAGGPGASKSTILETYLHAHSNFVYADPDQQALRYMINTYLKGRNNFTISKASNYQDVLASGYEKWRGASNYIACTIMNEAFSKGYNIAHGTTSTAKQVTGLYEKLKACHYKIVLLLCGSTDQNRVGAINHRAATQGFVQSSEQDTLDKGKAFPERFPDYFKYGDEIHLYWTETFSKGSALAAIYDTKSKSLTIKNQDALDRFIRQYPTVVAHLNGANL